MPRLLMILVLAALASGCTLPASPTPETDATPSVLTTAPTQLRDEPVSAPSTKTPLDVTLRVLDRWVRPDERVVANATAPPGATVSWFLAPRNPDVPGEENYEFVPRSLGRVAPGSASTPTKLAELGRFAFADNATRTAAFNVTVLPDVDAGGTTWVTFVQDALGERFAPDEVYVGRGALLAVRNSRSATRIVEPVRVDQMVRVAPDGATASFAPPLLLGDYDLVVLARDAGDGWGQATARLIVASRKPDANVTLGPWTGSFGLAPAEQPDAHGFSSKYNYTRLDLSFEASSALGDGAVVRVRVLDANGGELASVEGAGGRIALANVPAGGYWAEVAPLAGVSVSYRVNGTAVLELVPPASFFNS